MRNSSPIWLSPRNPIHSLELARFSIQQACCQHIATRRCAHSLLQHAALQLALTQQAYCQLACVCACHYCTRLATCRNAHTASMLSKRPCTLCTVATAACGSPHAVRARATILLPVRPCGHAPSTVACGLPRARRARLTNVLPKHPYGHASSTAACGSPRAGRARAATPLCRPGSPAQSQP